MVFRFDQQSVARKRIELAKTAMRDCGVDALVFFDGDRYGRRFSCTSAFTALILSAEEDPLITAHCVEAAHAEDESQLEIVEIKDTLELKDVIRKLVLKKIGRRRARIGVVRWNASFENVRMLQELGCVIEDSSEAVLPKCLPKPFPEEMEALRKLSAVCDRGLESACNSIDAGVKEFEVAAEVDYAVRRSGVAEFAFPTLVASGYRSAFPHGWTSGKTIRKGDAVTVDIGPILGNYDGCVCRTFEVGGNEKWMNEIEVVRDAIYGALEVLKTAEKPQASEIDRVARRTIRKHGYKGFFTEKTGLLSGHLLAGSACLRYHISRMI
jgi:Xaa-Pro aminopeptidase